MARGMTGTVAWIASAADRSKEKVRSAGKCGQIYVAYPE
jgi:hypothetical protein